MSLWSLKLMKLKFILKSAVFKYVFEAVVEPVERTIVTLNVLPFGLYIFVEPYILSFER